MTPGAPPTDVTAAQTGLSTATVMWTAPPAPPAGGYQVQVTGGGIDTTANVSGTSYKIMSVNSSTTYSIQVRALSQHLPGEAGLANVTIRGMVLQKAIAHM